MKIEEAIKIIKSYDIPEINEVMRFVRSALYSGESNKRNFEEMVKVYKIMLNTVQKDKEIELNKTYYVTEWSKNSLIDGRFVNEETIREHAIINGIDCYFTNSNNRVYFKENIYTNKEEAQEVCNWQNSFGYDYEMVVSRENDVRKFIDFENFHWKLK